MIRIALGRRSGRSARLLRPGTVWFYLGRQGEIREWLAANGAAGAPVPLGPDLHRTAERLRMPFLEFMGNLGAAQINKPEWWASLFAGKNPYTSDFLLLLCHKALLKEIVARQREERGHVVVLVEDPWILADAATEFAGQAGVRVETARTARLREQMAFAWKGIRRRGFYAAHLSLSLAWMRFRRRAPPTPTPRRVGLVTFALPEVVARQEPLTDPYLGGLGETLLARGIPILRIVPNFPSLALLRAAARWGDDAHVLARESRWGDLLLCLRSRRPDRLPGANVAGVGVESLLDREGYAEWAQASFVTALVLQAQARRFFARDACNAVFYFYENQPWEKLMIMAAREAGTTRLIGSQHSTACWFFLPYFLVPNESISVPLPDVILTNGPLATQILRDHGGYPPNLVREAGSWRYSYLLGGTTAHTNGRQDARIVVVALTIDIPMARSVIRQVLEVASRPEAAAWSFVFKTHPYAPWQELGVPAPSLRNVWASTEPLAGLLDSASIAITHGTATIEAWVKGLKVLRVRPEGRLDLDPASWVAPHVGRVADESSLRDSLLETMREAGKVVVEKPRANEFFSPVKESAWLKEAQAEPNHPPTKESAALTRT